MRADPVVVLGGGVSGGSAACLLAAAGQPVTVLERAAGPGDKICGEFISGEALHTLGALGLSSVAAAGAPIGALRLIYGKHQAEARLPFQGAGLSRLVLDEALLRRAAALGAEVRRGVMVRGADAAAVQTDAGALAARAVLLATGKQELRGLARPLARAPEPLIGLKLHLRLHAAQRRALHGYVELVLFNGGYAGLQMVGGDTANLCLSFERGRFPAEAAQSDGLLSLLSGASTHFAQRLAGATPCASRPLSIFRVPYGYVYQGAADDDVFRLGDQAAVIRSFCGDGIAIALHSGRLAAETLLQGGTAGAYHRRLRQAAGRPVRLADALYRLGRDAPARWLILRAAQVAPGLLRLAARRTRVAGDGSDKLFGLEWWRSSRQTAEMPQMD